MAIFLRGNDALITNPATEVTDSLSIDGSDWLWAVTAIFVASFVSFTRYTFQLGR